MSKSKVKSNMVPERYEFDEITGRGGMGTVVKAWDKVLQRQVAIKKLSEDLIQYEEAVSIFLTEARAMATLKHRNLVAVYDIIDDSDGEDGVYMVQEFVNGRTLEELLRVRANGLSTPTALKCLVQLLSVVGYLHDEETIHRDLKPANIMIQTDGTLRLVDFGLARSLQYLGDRGTKIRGTPAYMSPEQLVGDPLTPAVDIYQIGVTFFELLSGKLPFYKGDVGYAHVHLQPPTLLDVKPDIHPELSQLIDDCLVKDPSKRINTTKELFRRLQPIYAEVCDSALDTSHGFTYPSTAEFEAYRVSSVTHPRVELPPSPDTKQTPESHESSAQISALELRLKKLESSGHNIGEPRKTTAPYLLAALMVVLLAGIVWFMMPPKTVYQEFPAPTKVAAKVPANPSVEAHENVKGPAPVAVEKAPQTVAVHEPVVETFKEDELTGLEAFKEDSKDTLSTEEKSEARKEKAKANKLKAAWKARVEERNAENAAKPPTSAPQPTAIKRSPKPVKSAASVGVGLAPVTSSNKGKAPLAGVE